MRHFLLFLLFIFFASGTIAQVFVPIQNQPQGRMHAAAAWVDIKGEGKLDLVVSGEYLSGKTTKISTSHYRQTGKDSFRPNTRGLPDFFRGDMDAGDFNKNGRTDLVLTGMGANNQPVSGIYLAQADGSFSKADIRLPQLVDASVEFGDYNQNGFLDVLISGRDSHGRPITSIYRNDEGQLTDINARLPGIYAGKATWGDANGNGRLDVLITGMSAQGPISRIYINAADAFRALPQRFPALHNSDAVWADFDNDGQLDFIISGETAGGMLLSRIYRNMGGLEFMEMPTPGIRPLKNVRIDVGDYDLDGDLDIVMAGESLERPYTLVYENRGAFDFVDIMAGLPGVSGGMVVFGDYDGDGDLDLFVAGLDVCYDFVGMIFRNTTDPEVERDEPMDIFIESPPVDYSKGPYYYFVWSTCFCDPYGGENKQYHAFISNIHREERDFELNYKFNEILIRRFPNWGEADRGHRSSNAFVSRRDAETGRQQIIDSYTAEGFIIHYFEW